jgi:hypothetical protein
MALIPAEAWIVLKPLIFFIIGLAIYAIVVFNLYRFVARRDIFELNLGQYNRFQHPFLAKTFGTMLYMVEYLLFFPLFLMFWFIIFSAILIAITTTQDVSTILLVSMALISSIRVTSYYKQALSKDIAKLLPFTLLAIFLIDIGQFSWGQSINLINQIPNYVDTIKYYFVFAVSIEFILRIIHTIKTSIIKRRKN